MVSALELSTQKTPGLDTSGKKPLHGQWLISLVIGQGLERLSYQLTLVFHISVFLSMSVSTRKLPPHHIWVLKTHHFKLHFVTYNASSSHTRPRLIRSGLVLLVHNGSQRFFFMLKSLWGPRYFSAKRLLSGCSSIFPVSTMTRSTFQCPGKWNYQLAHCTACTGAWWGPQSNTVSSRKYFVYHRHTWLLDGKRKKKKLCAPITCLFTFSFGDTLIICY